jgi:glycosyltransferase involved in cell wall biosynthesis
MNKRIAIISDHASPLAAIGGVDAGGQNIYVAQIARCLAAAGYQVDVFTRRDSRNLPQIQEYREGVRVINVPAGPARYVRKEDLLPYMDEFALFTEDFFLKKGGYPVVHANFWMSGLVAMKLKHALGVPFIITFHALGKVRRIFQKEADEFPAARLEIEESIVACADRIIAECPQDRRDLMTLYSANPSRITTVPCGFDPEELWPVQKRAARTIIGIPPDERVVLQLGRLVPRKGIETVVRAFGRLKKNHGVAAKLLIVGGASEIPDAAKTPEIGRLKAVMREEGLQEEVLFCGRASREELKFYYSAADIFVTTPWYEPFGITPVEAMACGIPVIGSNTGGIKFTVKDGETGYLVPPRDAAALAARLAGLLREPDRAAAMGSRALERARRLFTWDTVTRSIADVYEEITAATCPSYSMETGTGTIL